MTDVHPAPRKSFHGGWLAAAIFLGAALVAVHLAYAADERSNELTAIMADVGVALALFALLLVYQTRLVERSLAHTLRAISHDELREQWNRDDNPLTPGDFYNDLGPYMIGTTFTELAAKGRFDSVWPAYDVNLRECRSQLWVMNSLRELGLTDSTPWVWQQVAEHVMQGPHENDMQWASFSAWEKSSLLVQFGDFDPESWGWSQRRRIIGAYHEVVLATPQTRDARHGFETHGVTELVENIQVLVSCIETADGLSYLVAGWNTYAPPLPGWPPSVWKVDDPLASQLHPGIQVERQVRSLDGAIGADDKT